MLARSSNFLLALNPDIPEWAFERARSDGMVVMTSDDEDRVRALVRLDLAADACLYVGRLVERNRDASGQSVPLRGDTVGRRHIKKANPSTNNVMHTHTTN